MHQYSARICIIFSLLLFNCSYYSYKNEAKPLGFETSPKFNLGIVIQRRFLTNSNEPHERKLFTLLTLGAKRAISSLNQKYGNQMFTLLDTVGENIEFDFTQEYRDFPKKNIIEFKYDYKQVHTNTYLTLLTLGLFPTKGESIWVLYPTIYDKNGMKTDLSPIENYPMNEYLGILLFPFWIFQSNEILSKQAEDSVMAAILESLETGKGNQDQFENYDHTYVLKSLPFRMKTSISACGGIVGTGLNSPNVRTSWYPKPPNHGCRVELNFLNLSDRDVHIRTDQFKLVTSGKEYAPVHQIEIKQVYYQSTFVSTNSQVVTVDGYFKIDPKSSPIGGITIYFEYPMGEKPTLVRWQDSEQFKEVIESTITQEK